ncbi:MAG: family 16 glycosylhydrolase, partial [Armatimonadota bacterium]|nr:family 16 glycosylhydrolase [Armatimonadota bacterium]
SPPTRVFVESTPDEFAALKAFWKDTTKSEAHKGEPLDLSGWVLDFEDTFDKHTVTNDVTGKGNWFAPTHGDPCGKAVAVVPPVNAADPTIGTEGTPATYIHGDSTMTIRMQSTGKSDSGELKWKSGAFCSVNSNGYGRTWMYPYIEARMKIGSSSTGNRKGAWPALWVKSANFFGNRAESNLEYDIYEGYISDPKGFHNSYHNWPAQRKLPGRLEKHRSMSNYLGLKTPGWHENVDLFDGQYHTYGVMVKPDWVINMFDGREMFRFPTPVEMKQPLWILVDLALGGNKDEPRQADGIYELTIDTIKVYQHPDYPRK